MKLQDKIAVITGAGSGIGREVAWQALHRGARVAALDLRADALDAMAAQAGAGERLSTHVANVADRDRINAVVDEVVAHHGTVDAVINVAGIIQPFVRVADLDYGAIERVLDVNLYGTMHVVKAFLPILQQRPEAHIANVSSMGGFLPVPGQAIYGASKAAVKLLTEALYAELLETPIGVSVILPGAIATDVAKNSGVTMEDSDATRAEHRTTSAPEAGRMILDGIERGRLYVHIGSDARLMHWMVRLAPRRAIHLIQKQMKQLLS